MNREDFLVDRENILINQEEIVLAEQLVEFINDSPTPYNVVDNLKKDLSEAGLDKLETFDEWKIENGGRYYLEVNSSSIISFVVEESFGNTNFRIIGSHSDSPCFKIKPKSEIKIDGGIKLSVEPYGGMIISSWLDRPLAIAGRVFVKNTENYFEPKEYIINIKKPLCIIPNLAIHMNPNVNTGLEYNKQNDVMPLVLETGERIDSEEYIREIISEDIRLKYGDAVAIDEIVDFELFLYEYEAGKIIGSKGEYLSCSRLDNLASVYPSIKSLIKYSQNKLRFSSLDNKELDENRRKNNEKNHDNLKKSYSIKMAVAFNHEEVGSMSGEGADSNILANVMERIILALGNGREEFLRCLHSSFMISADLSHAVHPNKPEKSDSNHKLIFGNGPAIKAHAGKAYATDSFSASVIKSICDDKNIKYQIFVNRSDMRSGATIGSIVSSKVIMPVVDIGMPILSMHSIRELGMIKDYVEYYNLMAAFYEK
ncbi:M18 family aminopeptidase [Peptostreptococcus porci]|uniref:M18 family aminopeptidase n=1 Tax=Peptostreptococcus porci TaxID=2652282 RepID=UPI002A90D990|nr:M18 family aminopeptidase [Peptostreptococcus porci]MDY6231547.1 M18 family aminopeptidase [Peptostreptococcus porci]